MNSITDLLNLEDPNVFVSDIRVEGTTKFITVESHPSARFCPVCGFRMYSKGIKKRNINHPMLQDTYELRIILKQRRWKCTNPICGFECNEAFKFVNKFRRSTNATDMLIIDSFRDLSATAVDIAAKFHTSDTHVLSVFDNYVKLDRLELTDAISVDEVHLEMDEYCKYALVIQDFHTGDPIDLLISRRTNVTEPYFANIPKEERYSVKYLISDMYNPYICFVDKYFPNAVSVVDSFHVVQWINHQIEMYLRRLIKEFKTRDQERADRISIEKGFQVVPQVSNEVYLLQKFRWLILMNQSSITYHADTRFDRHFRYFMNTYDYERRLFDINPNLRQLRDLKEIYVQFNERNAGNPEQAAIEIEDLIDMYLRCDQRIFVDFALLLSKHKERIINSFIMVSRIGPGGIYDSRLSNGPMESLNRKVKDLKRLGRGYRNFSHFRNRFLFSTRNNPTINGNPDARPELNYIEEE